MPGELMPESRGKPVSQIGIVAGSVLIAGLTVVSGAVFGVRGVTFAFLVTWLPMTAAGLLSRVVRPRMPQRWFALRRWELDGRVYRRLGVLIVKRLLRRGPLAVFNPDLHLPADRSGPGLDRLDRRMRDAEASHAILLLATLAVVGHAAVRGWWAAAGWTLLFDVLVNGYPVMLQRYNRALLRSRFGLG
jgi:hypothetical protein